MLQRRSRGVRSVQTAARVSRPRASIVAIVTLAGAVLWLGAAPPDRESPIRFVYQPIDFRLENCETPERHAPETMAGGVAVFDYNNDGKLDIFFTNGANIHTQPGKPGGLGSSSRILPVHDDQNWSISVESF